MIVRIPKNRITLSVIGLVFLVAGIGAGVQDHSVIKFAVLAGAAALMFRAAARHNKSSSGV